MTEIIMTTHTILHRTNRDHIVGCPSCRDHVGLDDDEQITPDNKSSFEITYWLGQMTGALRQYMSTYLGLTVNETTITFDDSLLNDIDHLANLIFIEYNSAIDVYPQKTPLWGMFSLSGDDDVDYNGSYINVACDILRHVIKA